ncbi:MAG: alpha/beta fold hydrolase [Chitinophagales bacterium]|nr:alpha/beta fold hydrolase [Chitinophagales bacterium]
MATIELVGRDRVFSSLEEYFDHVSEAVGFPKLYQHFQSDTFESDGLRLHADIYEHSPNAPTIVFMPGTAIYSLCYAEFLYALGQHGFNIVGFDPRGHGQSEGTRGDYTISELMTDASNAITYAINRFNDNVSLIGSSQGGIVSFYLAAQDKRLKSVVCQNFADLTWEESMKLTRFPRLARYAKPLLMKFGKIMPDTPVPVSMYLDLEKIKVKYFGNAKNFMMGDPLALQSITFRALHSLATTEIPKPIEEIDTPVMVFQGTADSIFPVDYTRSIFDRLKVKKRFRLFEGLDHAIMVENPDIIVRPIAEWLEEVH